MPRKQARSGTDELLRIWLEYIINLRRARLTRTDGNLIAVPASPVLDGLGVSLR